MKVNKNHGGPDDTSPQQQKKRSKANNPPRLKELLSSRLWRPMHILKPVQIWQARACKPLHRCIWVQMFSVDTPGMSILSFLSMRASDGNHLFRRSRERTPKLSELSNTSLNSSSYTFSRTGRTVWVHVPTHKSSKERHCNKAFVGRKRTDPSCAWSSGSKGRQVCNSLEEQVDMRSVLETDVVDTKRNRLRAARE